MRDSYPKSLLSLLKNSLVTTHHPLQIIQHNAKIINKLNLIVKSLLPSETKLICRVAHYRNSILIIEVVNASWLMRLNYEKFNLISTLRKSILPSLFSIDIRINPLLMKKAVENSSLNNQTVQYAILLNKRKISTDTAQHLLRLAQNSSKKLKERLERLAALADKPEHF
ncbi:hypothetical protein GFV14_00363 [Candidatus Hartigia pinicola]|nr:hypothetical protein GFV14_00363 [Candidatus Hartigia pinicola]